MTPLHEIIVFLIAAVIAVPLSKRLGFGSVLGYLGAGVVIGPGGLGLITHVHDTLHFSELGVVLLLFIIGLELHPQRLWVLRKPLIGLGCLQTSATTLVFGGIAWSLGLSWKTALVIGICFSLSSTAFALQLLHEKKQFFTVHGRNAFAILLFQDLLVIPVLALLPLLGMIENTSVQGNDLADVGRSIGIILGVILAGHLLIRPLLRLVAAAEIPELFCAASLLVVIGTASLMQSAGLSMALGAFLAGVLLANSEFRHELEANIEPFKGLLLGLFFISVGMSVDLGLLFDRPLPILSIVLGLLLIKIIILFAIAKLNNQPSPSAINLAFIISQGGEFGFVILNQAAATNVIDGALANLLTVVISISMALTPMLVALNEYWQKTWTSRTEPERPFDDIEDNDPKVIIAGFGRFGQIVARILSMKKIRFTALESSFEQVDFVRKFGNKIYFGDATRVELLRAARADKAGILVLSIVNIEASLKAAEVIKKNFPNLRIFARARNRQHVYKLMDIGVDYVIRETFLSSIELASNVLTGLGIKNDEAEKIAKAFREYDEALIKRQHAIHHNEEEVIAATKRAALELQSLFEEDTGFVVAPPDTTPE